jgi:hypothetical protein
MWLSLKAKQIEGHLRKKDLAAKIPSKTPKDMPWDIITMLKAERLVSKWDL